MKHLDTTLTVLVCDIFFKFPDLQIFSTVCNDVFIEDVKTCTKKKEK